MSGCARSARPIGRSRKQCKPDAKRKRDSAQLQERVQPSSKGPWMIKTYRGMLQRGTVFHCAYLRLAAKKFSE